MNHTVYYLPGYGGQLHTGLGEGLLQRGFNVAGRATVGDFRGLPFEQQVATVATDLQEHFWHPSAQVVANSFGAYLFLHAQMGLNAFPGRVLLLSPIVGSFEEAEKGLTFEPPYAGRLFERIQSSPFAMPSDSEIHVGELDWQSVPHAVQHLGHLLNVSVTVAPGRGHMLGKDYVGPLLDRWLQLGAPS